LGGVDSHYEGTVLLLLLLLLLWLLLLGGRLLPAWTAEDEVA